MVLRFRYPCEGFVIDNSKSSLKDRELKIYDLFVQKPLKENPEKDKHKTNVYIS